MTLDLENLRALALAATPGPWTYCRMTEKTDPEIAAANGSRVAALVCADVTKANSAHMAAANPAVILALLDLVQAQAESVARYDRLMARAGEQVAGLLTERNNLITERNNALQRALKAEYRPAVRTRAGDHAAVPDPNDRLDDVLPLPLNLPASLDLVDSEGGHAD